MTITRKYYSEVDQYHEMAERSHSNLMVSGALLKPFLKQGSWVIDIGGGTGFNAELLEIDPSKYISADLSMKGLLYVSEKRRGSALVCDVSRLPFKDGVCSSVLCSWSLEHFEEPAKVLNEMIRLLEDGGRAIIWGPNWDNIFRKDFPQFVHKSRLFVERMRMRIFFKMVRNEFLSFRYAPFISTDVAAFAEPQKYISSDTDAVHAVLCQETVKFFEGRGLAIIHLSDFSEMSAFLRNSLFIRLARSVLKPLLPVLKKIPLVKWFVIRFPLVVEKGTGRMPT